MSVAEVLDNPEPGVALVDLEPHHCPGANWRAALLRGPYRFRRLLLGARPRILHDLGIAAAGGPATVAAPAAAAARDARARARLRRPHRPGCRCGAAAARATRSN